MQILIFKTNIHNRRALRKIQPVLDACHNILKWTIDTEDIDKVLRIEASTDLSYPEIIELVKKQDFFCEELKD